MTRAILYWLRAENGQTVIEYTLVIGFVSLVLFVGLVTPAIGWMNAILAAATAGIGGVL